MRPGLESTTSRLRGKRSIRSTTAPVNLQSLARLFADDTSLSFSSADHMLVETILNNDLKVLQQWAKYWVTTFNPIKTEVLWISNLMPDYQPQLFFFDSNLLNIVGSHKHLGVFLSSNCKWSSHIDSIVSATSKQVSYLRKLKYKLSSSVLSIIYKTYNLPLL